MNDRHTHRDQEEELDVVVVVWPDPQPDPRQEPAERWARELRAGEREPDWPWWRRPRWR